MTIRSVGTVSVEGRMRYMIAAYKSGGEKNFFYGGLIFEKKMSVVR